MAEGALLEPPSLEDAYAPPAAPDVPQEEDLESIYAPPSAAMPPPEAAEEDFTQYYEPPEVAPATAAAVDGAEPVSDPALEAIYTVGPTPHTSAAAAAPIPIPEPPAPAQPQDDLTTWLDEMQITDPEERKLFETLPERPQGERPPLAQGIARWLDTVAAKVGGGGLEKLVEEGTYVPEPEEPSFLHAGIPTIPQQEGKLAQVGAGLANLPIGFANFLLSPGGAATATTIGMLPRVGQILAGAGFTADQVRGFFNAETLQDKVTTAVGSALLGLGTALHIRGGGEKPSATKEIKQPEGVQEKLEDRIESRQEKAAGVSDRIQRPAESRPEEIGTALVDEAGAIIEQSPPGAAKTHAELMKQAMGTPREDAAIAALANDKQHVFVRGEEVITRDQLEQSVGVRQSEELIELQQSSKPVEAVQEAPSPEVSIAPEAAAKPAIPEQFKTKNEVRDLLEQQKVEPEAPALKVGEERPEGGALGFGGGKRPAPVKAIGVTPAGDKNFLRIPSPIKRLGRGLLTEGVRNALGRTKNKVGQILAKASRQHVDIEQELFGQHEKIMRDALTGIPKARKEGAFAEVSSYIREVENNRPAPTLQPDAQKILDAWYEIGRSTGDIARANGVQVQEANGQYRPMGTVDNYVPRMFKSEVEAVLRDPDSNPTLFNKLADDLAKHRGVTPEEAATELRESTAARFSGNDFMGNLEMARKEALPESFYEYDLRNLASRYLPSFSERMAQIIAYGQRLGRPESPVQPNLWDVARKETGGHTDSQEWLNAAEDQATNAKPRQWGIRGVRRAQALGNTFLLSDPTTTVVRNMLSGLTVTTERFGVGRSLRGLMGAGKTASRLGAREIGVLRDDIGTFLGAEQLGDAKADRFIRSLQQKALSASGFSASETFVRSHGALVSSTFARDAAASLAKNPASRLSKEALAYFKRLDVDAEKIMAEGGDWKTGAETRKFIRSSVRESQGGYRFDQVPLWAGTTAGRFLYQYGRWAIQRAGDIVRNTVRPAIGETVEFRGQKMTRRNVLPLMRLGLMTAGLGEAFAGITSLLFDRDRKDATFQEIGEAMNDDELKAAGLLGERIVNDVITAGTLGLLSQPLDFIKATKDQTRFKNPAAPPSLFGVTALVNLAQKAYDQGGSLTKRDIMDFAGQVVRGPKNVMEVARAQAGETLYRSQNDQRTLRNAARRWAKEEDLDVAPPSPAFGDFRKSPNAPVFEGINDALMSGDPVKAHDIANKYIDNAENPERAKKAVHSSIVGKHPFRAGQFTSAKHQEAFMEWAETHLPEQDFEQVTRVIDVYEQTAKDAALLYDNPSKSPFAMR